MSTKKPKKKTTPLKKTAELDIMHDHVLRSGMVSALALFTLLLLIPLSPCVSDGKWKCCGEAGWNSLSPMYAAEQGALWFGGVDLTEPARWIIFAGLFGVLYMLYLKVYNCIVAHHSR